MTEKARRTLTGRAIEASQKRSVLKGGLLIRTAVHRMLPTYDPFTLDRLTLPHIGALLGNDLVDSPDISDVDGMMARRAARVVETAKRRRD